MATSIRLIGFFALVVLISGCKETSKLSVTIEGQGQVASTPAGIECDLGKNTCEMTISGSVTLSPVAPEDGSYVFAEWIGACTGSSPSCLVSKASSVTARFRATDEIAAIPTPPRASSANSFTSTIVYVYWTSASDDVTPAQELQYRVYISRHKDNLVNAANLVAQVRGNSTGLYEREIDVSSLLASDSDNRVVQVAIVAIDGDGNEGQASYLYDIAMMSEDIQIRRDIVVHFADEEGYPMPVRGARGMYTLTFPNNATVLPAAGEYIAFDDGTGDDIIKVIGVTGRIVRAGRANLSEIIAKPIEMSGSSNFSRQPGDTTETDTTGDANESSVVPQPSSSQLVPPSASVPELC